MKSLRHLMPAPAIALLICAVAGCGGSSGGGPDAGALAFKPRAEALCHQIDAMAAQKATLYEKATEEIHARPDQGDAIIHRVSREALQLAKPMRIRVAVLRGLKPPAATRQAFGFMVLTLSGLVNDLEAEDRLNAAPGPPPPVNAGPAQHEMQKIRALDRWAEEANLPGCRAGG